MRPNEIQTLFEYSWWTTDHLLNRASEILVEQFTAPNALPHGSIRGTFQHLIMAAWVWKERVAYDISPTSLRLFQEYETLDEIRAQTLLQREQWRAYLADLTEEQLLAPVSWKNTKGLEATAPLWQVLTHVTNHAMQHHSEIAQELTVLGFSPGGIDFIYYIIAQQKAS